MNSLLILFCRFFNFLSTSLQVGNGTTWPGHVALGVDPKIIKEIIAKNPNLRIILVAGTNGKTTTSLMLRTILEKNGNKIFQNESGANLLNGIASTFLLNADLLGVIAKEYAVLEVDENALPLVLKEVTPDYLILLNLFRDQLDRYGEVRTIAAKWKAAFRELKQKTHIVANGDDPEIVWMCRDLKQPLSYFGMNGGKQTSTEHAADSTYCPKCGSTLRYSSVQFSHLGNWNCPSCGLKRPQVLSEDFSLPLVGAYNRYNGLAALVTAQNLGIDKKTILYGLSSVKPAFGRQESFEKDGRTIKIFLSKNPTGMNESLRAIKELDGTYYLFLLNDRVPDGRDVSWVWDVDFETLVKKTDHVFASGDRAFDMSVRLKYAHPTIKHVDTYELIDRAFETIIRTVPQGQTLYILPTYSAMLEIRKHLTGKKIL